MEVPTSPSRAGPYRSKKGHILVNMHRRQALTRHSTIMRNTPIREATTLSILRTECQCHMACPCHRAACSSMPPRWLSSRTTHHRLHPPRSMGRTDTRFLPRLQQPPRSKPSLCMRAIVPSRGQHLTAREASCPPSQRPRGKALRHGSTFSRPKSSIHPLRIGETPSRHGSYIATPLVRSCRYRSTTSRRQCRSPLQQASGKLPRSSLPTVVIRSIMETILLRTYHLIS